MATIIQISSSVGFDKGLAIAQETIANKLSVGTDWRWIRLGILYVVNSNPQFTASIGSINLAAGLSSGTSSLYGSVNGPTHFVGLITPPTMSMAGGAFISTPYYTSSPQITSNIIGKQIGSGSSEAAVGTHIYGFGLSGTGSVAFPLSVIYLDFIKKSNTTTPQVWDIIYTGFAWPTVNYSTIVTITNGAFYSYLSEITSSLGGVLAPPYVRNSFYLPVSESINGVLDTVNIYWNKTFPLNIHEIAVYRFA